MCSYCCVFVCVRVVGLGWARVRVSSSSTSCLVRWTGLGLVGLKENLFYFMLSILQKY